MNKYFYVNVIRKDHSNMVYIVSGLLEQELIQEVSKQKDVVKIETIQQPKLDGKISVIETIYEI